MLVEMRDNSEWYQDFFNSIDGQRMMEEGWEEEWAKFLSDAEPTFGMRVREENFLTTMHLLA